MDFYAFLKHITKNPTISYDFLRCSILSSHAPTTPPKKNFDLGDMFAKFGGCHGDVLRMRLGTFSGVFREALGGKKPYNSPVPPACQTLSTSPGHFVLSILDSLSLRFRGAQGPKN